MPDAASRAVVAVWRPEAAKRIGAVARLNHDVGVAEGLAADALVAALEPGPKAGVASEEIDRTSLTSEETNAQRNVRAGTTFSSAVAGPPVLAL